MDPSVEVLIVGAGPVGLLLGCRLAQLGVSFKIVEKRTSRFLHSRSIGIHPPSLEKLETLGVVSTLLQRGVKIERGHGFINTTYLGALDFSACKKPYNFVLSLPQFETEAVLEKRLCELAPGSLWRGVEVVSLEQGETCVSVKTRVLSEQGTQQQRREQLKLKIQRQNPHTSQPYSNLRNSRVGQARFHPQQSTLGGEQVTVTAKFVVACDGKDSRVRQLAGIPFHGGDYPDTYLMGDFADTTTFGSDAAIYLTRKGLVESFPLADGMRRWVAKTEARVLHPSAKQLAALIKERLNIDLPTETNSMLSSFGVQHYLAASFVKHRVVLAGDAAHVVSPIGGQGMNLGWFDAWALADSLAKLVGEGQVVPSLQSYDEKQQRMARKVLRRAAFNMQMGRATRSSTAKYVFAKLLLKKPFATMIANMFTMRGL
jgi:2-polyprenyl-6-methoxyphenol hydroxylase-like FAD-dependent oxidoreductase